MLKGLDPGHGAFCSTFTSHLTLAGTDKDPIVARVSSLRILTKYLKLLPVFARLERHAPQRGSVFYHPLGDLGRKAVDREAFLRGLCKRKRVLHFGFVDSPFSAERTKQGKLLHQLLQSVTALIYGLDIDTSSIEEYRKLTGDRQNACLDIQQPLPQADFLSQNYDVILFGEILEHLLYPAAAMANLLRICELNPKAQLCITVPNAYSAMAFFTALSGDELVHPDHYYYFSPVTLSKLVRDTGFKLAAMYLYGEPMTMASPGITKHGLIALCEVPDNQEIG